MMQDQKPLPQLPKEPLHGGGVLAVDARTHRGRLIRHFLTEVHDPDIASRRDGWVYVLEEVLDDLGRQLSQGGWLESMKHAQVWRMRQRLDEREAGVEPEREEEEKPLPPRPSGTVIAVARLHKLMRRRSHVGQNGHLLLCVAPYGRQPVEDGGFHLLPANIGCDFSPGSFVVQDDTDTVLYGWDGLEGDSEDDAWRLVGGTFTFKGVSQPVQHSSLRTVLRLAIYVHLSLVLEQHLLAAMHVPLTFPRPKLLTPSPSSPSNLNPSPTISIPFPFLNEPRGKPLRTSLIPSSVTNFFLKRGFSYRSQTIDPLPPPPPPPPPAPAARRTAGSMDVTVIPASPTAPSLDAISRPVEGLSMSAAAAVTSAHLRLRRFSSIMGGGDRRPGSGSGSGSGLSHHQRTSSHHQRTPSHHQRTPSHAADAPTDADADAWTHSFATALQRIEDCKTLLSTSPGVAFAPPRVVVELMEGRKRIQNQKEGGDTDTYTTQQESASASARRRLRGDERVALTSVLGWEGRGKGKEAEGKEAEGKEAEGRGSGMGMGMSGIPGFVRHQAISVLCSVHVPPPPPPHTTTTATTTAAATATATATTSPSAAAAPAAAPPPPTTTTKAPTTKAKAVAAAASSPTASASTASVEAPPAPPPSPPPPPPNTVDVDADASTTTQPSDRDVGVIIAPAPPIDIQPPHVFPAPANLNFNLNRNYNLPQPGLAPCGKPRWRTYRYYSNSNSRRPTGSRSNSNSEEEEDDVVLGRWVREYVAGFGVPCSRSDAPGGAGAGVGAAGVGPGGGGGGGHTKGKHEWRLIHDGVRIVIRATEVGREEEEEEEEKETEKEGKEEKEKEEKKKGKENTEKENMEKEKADGAQGFGRRSEKGKEKENKEKENKEKENKEKEDVGNPPRAAYDEDIEVWASCAVCNAATSRKKLEPGAYLVSFGKFLEMLLYSPAICTLTPRLCEHTSSSPPAVPVSASVSGSASGSESGLPASRLNIIRHFSVSSVDITMALSTIEDVFEIRVPRVQVVRGTERVTPPSSSSGIKKERSADGESPQKRPLRREIREWWQGVSEHIDKIELILNADEPTSKTLPRLPSVDDAYEIFNTLEASQSRTHTGRFPFVPHSTPNTPAVMDARGHSDSYFALATPSSVSTATQESQPPPANDTDDPEVLLARLRHNFQKIEQSLYAQLARTPDGCLNDVRRAFLATGRGTQKRLRAWQRKHLGGAKAGVVGELKAAEPEWWGTGWHVLPGVSVVVRDDDWGSIIAHTLSTPDYQLELANLSVIGMRGGSHSHSSATPAEATPSSFFSVATGYRLFTASASSSKNQPDPDQEDVVWNEPEQFSAVISRKDHPRDPTSLLSIRDVLRQSQKAGSGSHSHSHSHTDPSAPVASNTTSRFGAPSNASTASVAAAHVSKSKPDVGLNMEFADGTLVTAPSDAAENILQQQKNLENAAVAAPSRPASISSVSNTGSTVAAVSEPKRSTSASIISSDTDESKDTIKKPQPAKTSSSVSSHSDNGDATDFQPPPPPPPKDTFKRLSSNGKASGTDHVATPSTSSTAPSAWKPTPSATTQSEASTPASTTSGFVSNLAHGINSAMRLVIPGRESPSRPPTPSTSTLRKHHALLADITSFDERPHIKYDWTVGKRLKFSCTVYYAKQFDLLRKRYGIHDTFVHSLSRSTNWAATGGKSRSNFWKTTDEQFIIKTLVNAWNVADLQVLIELAPSYFRYMDATASRATVLVKLLGFYTIEIRNLETGAVQSKVDLLVMENLFYKQNISKTFDLKGIQGRKVKTQGDTTKTLFDGEWIEGQQRTLTLIRPHSKAVLRDAIKNDAEFLAKSNIMDYSLLLGIDEEKKNISCGLVDTIGSFTFAKTLEYKAKQGLQSGKEVTVMPPAEYQERFVNALEGYFVACPDKWSKPFDEDVKINSDPDLLPSVL